MISRISESHLFGYRLNFYSEVLSEKAELMSLGSHGYTSSSLKDRENDRGEKDATEVSTISTLFA